LPTPPLFNALLKPIKQSEPATQDIMEIPVTHLVKNVPPLPTPPLSNAPLVPIKQSQRVTQDIMDLPVMLLAKRVLLVLLQILEQALGQHRVVLALPEVIRCRRTLLHVRPVMPDPLQIPEPVLGQHHVLLAPLVRIHYRRTLQRVRPVPPLPTPPLFNALLKPIKQSQPAT
jgi:hypothetical protein